MFSRRLTYSSQFKSIEEQYGTDTAPISSKSTIGGHKYDITKWSREERAEYAFDHKDPLPDEILQGLKEGKEIMIR